ncbi:N/A [soil metagenome]
MAFSPEIVVFKVDGARYALWVSAVERIVAMPATRALPGAPDIISGVINNQGAIIPVVNLRRRLQLPEKENGPSDHMVFARTARRRVALCVDEVLGVESIEENQWVDSGELPPGSQLIAGVVKRPDGMILIQDLDTFLSLDEERALESALAAVKE